MERRQRTTTDNGYVRVVADVCPGGYTIIDTYRPHSTPWDYHGGKHLREMRALLADVCPDVPVALLRETHTSLCPTPSGSGGSVRFGDDMLPGVYHVAVPYDNATEATHAIADYKVAISRWVHDDGPRPKLY